jgi:hypothetical protein
MLLVLLPWMAHGFVCYGAPLVSLTTERNTLTGIVQGGNLFYSLQQYDVGALVWEHLDVLWAKLARLWVIRHALALFGREFPWLAPLFLLGGLLARGRQVRLLWAFCCATLVLTAIAYGITLNLLRFYSPFAPLVLVATVGTISLRFPITRSLAGATMALASLVSLALIVTGTQAHRPARVPRYFAGPPAGLCSSLPATAVVASDDSARIAWDCDLPTIRFFGDAALLEEIDAGFVPVGAVVLTRAESVKRFRASVAGNFPRGTFRRIRLERGARLWLHCDAPAGKTRARKTRGS